MGKKDRLRKLRIQEGKEEPFRFRPQDRAVFMQGGQSPDGRTTLGAMQALASVMGTGGNFLAFVGGVSKNPFTGPKGKMKDGKRFTKKRRSKK